MKSTIVSVLAALEDGDFEKCTAILDTEIQQHNENKSIDFFLESVLFWKKRIENIERISDPIDQARYLLGEWHKYKSFCSKYKNTSDDLDRHIFVFRKLINNKALSLLTAALSNPLVNEQQAHLYIARAHKGNGNYEQAILEYRQVIAGAGQCASAYAELGDCYLLIGNELIGRLFLREAFYIDPNDIDFSFLESELMTNMINKIYSVEGVNDTNYKKWIPVYAILWDVFTVKRDLKTAEYGMLRQQIYALEREYNETKNSDIEPRLLYAYFYLLDYYHKLTNMQIGIDETMIKIKGINPKIYSMYTERKSAQ